MRYVEHVNMAGFVVTKTARLWTFCIFLSGLLWIDAPASYAMPTLVKLKANTPSTVIQIQERPSLFNRMFRRNNPSRINPQRVRPSTRQRAPTVRRQTSPRRTQPARRSAPVIQQTEKNEDARRILVLGDFFAGSLAQGLLEAYAQDRTVAIDQSVVSTSGFVRYDHLDWQIKLKELLGDAKLGGQADLVIVMMGGNDRQRFRVPKRINLNTGAWETAYQERVRTFARLLAERNLPVIWVGLPSVRGPKTSAHMQSLNGFYRDEAELIGGRFVDIWTPFADEDGRYVAYGPDVNGQRAQLRLNDGVGFTRAGRGKLTFFVKRQIDRFLSGQGVIAGTPGGMIITENGPVLSLTGFALEDAVTLLGGEPLIGPPMRPPDHWERISNAYNVLVRGVDMQAPEHRVDNFSWPSAEN